MLDKVLKLVASLQSDVDTMLGRPAAKDGRPGIDGLSGAAGLTGDAGRDGIDGRDGTSGADGRDGRDGTSASAEDVATLVQSRIRIPTDGKDGEMGVQGDLGAQGPQGPQGERGPIGATGPSGVSGRDGDSITALDIKDNTLFAAINGRRKKVGDLKFDAPRSFSPTGASGGGGAGYAKRQRIDALGFDSQYAPGDTVAELTAVYDDGWAMVSNKITDERAAPAPTGPEKQLYNGVLTPEQDTVKQVTYGIRVDVEQAAYTLSYRVDTVVGNEYQVFIVQDPLGKPVASELVNFTAAAAGWQEFNVSTSLLIPGFTFDLIVIVHEPDPTPVTFNGDWSYIKPGGGGGTTQPPLAGEIVHPNNAPGLMRISKTDNDAGDRSAELAALTTGDYIEGQGVRWAIQTIVDDGTYFSYGLAPAVQAQDTGVFNFVFETVTATPITFGRDVGYWDSAGLPNIRGLFPDMFGNLNPTPDAFGIDIKVQAASISADWDLLATSGSTGGGGGGGGGRRVELQDLDTFETSAAQSPTGLGAAGAVTVNYGLGGTTPGGEFTVSAAGVVTANAASGGAQHKYIVGLRVGRTGASGISIPVIRFMYAPDGIVGNAVQVGGTFSVQIDSADTTWREVFDLDFAAAVGSVVFVQFARDPAGTNFGGLQAPQPSGDLSDWNPVATARIEIKKRVTL